ncbi:MAG: amino acid ABC transporter permease [Nocardioidaceae bacterium]
MSGGLATVPSPAAKDGPAPATPPPPVLPVASAALVAVVLAGLCCDLTVYGVHELIATPPLIVDAVLLLAGVVAWLPLIPVVSSLLTSRRRVALLRERKIVEARSTAATGRGSAAVGAGYALAIFIISVLVAFTIANDGAVAHTFLRWEFLVDALGRVTKAFWVNIRVAVGAEAFVLALGLLVAIMRMLPGRAGRPLRLLAILYVDIFRAIPSIIVLYLVGFGLSLAKVPVVKDMPPIWLAIFALTLTYGGYVAEVYRAGLESIHPSQWAAARSLGLSYTMTLRTVIIPQAVRRMVPPLLNDFIGLQKDTALIGVMGVIDAFMQSRLVAADVFNLSPVIVVAALFVLVTIPQARIVDRLVAREQARQAKGAQ